MKEKFYITTAIAYTSKKPHIGNTYEVVFTDAIARFHRLLGEDVFFLTGTDEHGIKIQETAKNSGVSPKEHVDLVSSQVRNIWDLMNTSYDKFIRTTDDYHEKAVTEIFERLYKQGDIYKSEYSGLYCTPCETFYTQAQLVDGRCPDCGAEVKPANEEAYFFKVSKYQKQLEKYIEENPDFISPESRKKEMINNFIKPGLSDLCVSRTSFSWGIPVNFDKKHVIYVWIDALSNYITALGYSPEKKDELYNKYWPADVHIIGKDILRFHTIYWPIILMALGEPLPKKVFAHPWFLNGVDKMSKSKGNTIYADELTKFFPVDAIRFYLLSEMPYVQDGTITYENLIKRYNSELANTLGNLVNRTVAMCQKYFGGNVPNFKGSTPLEDEIFTAAKNTVNTVKEKMLEFRAAEAISAIFELLHRLNKYIDETAPWVLAKEENKDRLETVIYTLLDNIRLAATLLNPFLTATSDKILLALDVLSDDLSYEKDTASFILKSGSKINAIDALFPRFDEEKLLVEIFNSIPKKEEKKQEEKNIQKPDKKITIDDFSEMDLRVAKIIDCKNVQKSDKLLCLTLEVGTVSKTVVSGIAKSYTAEDLIGKKVILVNNLEPAKLRGTLSEGMILAAGENEPKVIFVDDSIESGTKIK